MTGIDASTLRRWLYDGDELALLDVREPGQIGEGHILFSAPLPYSRFELDLPRLVPNPQVRMVLCDDGDGVAARAAMRARTLGYKAVHVLDGGVQSWAEAGHTLYQGVNVPSKAFGELVELDAHTPRKTAEEVAEMQRAGADMVIVDGRPLAEYRKMNIPGARCCPNGELALRIATLAPDPATTVIVNCAGRTRSIIGAETLIAAGAPNPVFALENGTQGWKLADLALEHGNTDDLPAIAPIIDTGTARVRAQSHGVRVLTAAELEAALKDDRTTYLLDVRDISEREAEGDAAHALGDRLGLEHAPGGQLVQATDQWIGVRNARVVVLDIEEIRAPLTAIWLKRLGHDACVLDGGLAALSSVRRNRPIARARVPGAPRIPANALQGKVERSEVTVLDLRTSADYRAGHIPGAIWTTRARIHEAADPGPIVLVGDSDQTAALAVADLKDLGSFAVSILVGGMDAWRRASLAIEVTPDNPPDAERIDHLFFTAGRHEGDREASLAYLNWEVGLVDQLDADERAVFRI